MFVNPHVSAAEGGGNIRERLNALVDEVRKNPQDQKAVLKLSHLYGQIWVRQPSPEVSQRIVQCLERVIRLETGTRAAKIEQLINDLLKQANLREETDFATRLQALRADLASKVEQAPDEAEPETPEPTVSMPTPEAEPTTSPEPEPVAEPKAAPTADFEPEIHTETPEPAPEPTKQRAPVHDGTAATVAQEMKRVAKLFEERRVGEILQVYAGLVEEKVKRAIIDNFAKHIDEFHIEPLLAIGAMENDKQVFKHLMRQLTSQDHAKVLEMIHLEAYSRDLAQVAAVLLSDLGMRAALPKLKAALDMEDPIVRCVAAHGIGRQGKNAHRYIPLLRDIIKEDGDKNVRTAATKALQTMDSEEAYLALENVSHVTKLKPEQQQVLETMRQKFSDEAQEEDTPKAKNEKKEKKEAGNAMNMALKILGGLAAIGLLGFLLKGQFAKMAQLLESLF